LRRKKNSSGTFPKPRRADPSAPARSPGVSPGSSGDVAELPRETAMHAAARAQIKTRLRALEVEYNAKARARLRSVPEALEERLDRELAEIERRIAKFPR
jgi:hypothetical protein